MTTQTLLFTIVLSLVTAWLGNTITPWINLALRRAASSLKGHVGRRVLRFLVRQQIKALRRVIRAGRLQDAVAKERHEVIRLLGMAVLMYVLAGSAPEAAGHVVPYIGLAFLLASLLKQSRCDVTERVNLDVILNELHDAKERAVLGADELDRAFRVLLRAARVLPDGDAFLASYEKVRAEAAQPQIESAGSSDVEGGAPPVESPDHVRG